MKKIVIGIAGGSGTGKLTVATLLCKKYQDKVALLHVDDYFKKAADVPREGTFANWHSPEALRFDDLYDDALSLIQGKSVSIFRKNGEEYLVQPKAVLIIEGFLALFDERMRSLMDLKVYLDMPIDQSMKRRSEEKFPLNDQYLQQVLIPMHQKYVLPTKNFADVIIDVTAKTPEDVQREIERHIRAFNEQPL